MNKKSKLFHRLPRDSGAAMESMVWRSSGSVATVSTGARSDHRCNEDEGVGKEGEHGTGNFI